MYEMITQYDSQGRAVSVSDVRWDVRHRSITIGDDIISFTRVQYRLLFPLRHGTPVTYADLAESTYHCAVDSQVRTMMDKHIDRIRGKLRGTGIYIYCIMGYGYILLSES